MWVHSIVETAGILMLMEQAMGISSLSLSYNLRNPANTHIWPWKHSMQGKESTRLNFFLCECLHGTSLSAQWLKKKKKKSACQWKKHRLDLWVGKIPWGGKWQLIRVFTPGKSHGQRSLVGSSPWGCKEQD